METIIATDEQRKELREIIYSYFQTLESEVELISTDIFPNYVEVNFQAMPTTELSKLINNFKSVSARKFLAKFPEIRQEQKGLWNNSYFLATREQFVSDHVKEFMDHQWAARVAQKVVPEK